MNKKGEGMCGTQQAFSVTELQFVMMGDEEETVEDSKGGTRLGVRRTQSWLWV